MGIQTYYPVKVKLKVADRRYKTGYRVDTTSVYAHYNHPGRFHPDLNKDIACIAATSGNILELV